MMRKASKSSEGRSEGETTTGEVTEWVRRHAPLAELCRFGGWPDDEKLQVEVCSRTPREWIVNITFVETIMEISECDVTERERCGQYSVTFDKSGHPVGIHLVQPL